MINSVARAPLVAIAAHRDEYQRNSAALDKLVRDLLLPHLDSPLAAELVLGWHWTTATPAQRERFTDTFIRSMVRNHASQLLDFSLNRLQVFPYRGDLTADDAQVETVVMNSRKPICERFAVISTPHPCTTTSPERSVASPLTMP